MFVSFWVKALKSDSNDHRFNKLSDAECVWHNSLFDRKYSFYAWLLFSGIKTLAHKILTKKIKINKTWFAWIFVLHKNATFSWQEQTHICSLQGRVLSVQGTFSGSSNVVSFSIFFSWPILKVANTQLWHKTI